jgi:hypothetical protein
LSSHGCTLNDEIAQIAASSQSHDEFVSGVSLLSNELRKSGVLTKAQRRGHPELRGAIQPALNRGPEARLWGAFGWQRQLLQRDNCHLRARPVVSGKIFQLP